MELDLTFGLNDNVTFDLHSREELIIGGLLKIAVGNEEILEGIGDQLIKEIRSKVTFGYPASISGSAMDMAKVLMTADLMMLNVEVEISSDNFSIDDEDHKFFQLFDGLEETVHANVSLSISDMINNSIQKSALMEAFMNLNQKLPEVVRLSSDMLEYFEV